MPANLLCRDTLDLAARADELGTSLKYAGRGLAQAWEFQALINQADAKALALRMLKRTHSDLAGLIHDLETLPVEG